MNSSLERDLASVIESTVSAVAEPPADLYQVISRETTRRRRRRRILASGAVCATVTAVAAAALLLPVLRTHAPPKPGGPAAAVLPPRTADKLPNFAAAEPVELVWPEAIRRLPRTVDGQYLTPRAILPGDRYVVTYRHNVVNLNDPLPSLALGVFNAAARTFAALTRAGDPFDDESNVIGIVDDRVVWQTGKRGGIVPEIWVSRLDGSGSQRLAKPDPPASDGLGLVTVTDHHVVWTATASDGRFQGLYRVAATGGSVEQIPGSSGFSAAWPLPGLVNTTQTWIAGEPKGQVWDLDSGRHIEYVRNPAMSIMVCGSLDWCGGTAANQHAALQLPDGTGYLELPMQGLVAGLAGGRFARITVDRAQVVVLDGRIIANNMFWDLKTGRVGQVQQQAGGYDGLTGYAPGRTFASWEDHDDWVVLDFNRIP